MQRDTDMNIKAFLLDDGGQGLVEYALILALVSIVAIASLSFLGNAATNKLTTAGNALS
jgi:pilus assembly protein Flp/PilA